MKIIQIAGLGKKFGSGHLERQKIVKDILTELGYNSDIFKIEKKNDIFKNDLSAYQIIIKDFRDSNEKIDNFLGNSKVISFDDYFLPKIYRGYRLYYNSLPSIKDQGNIRTFPYLILNDFDIEDKNIDDYLNKTKSYDILICFGNLDPYDLSSKVAKVLNNKKNFISNESVLFILPEKKYQKIKNQKQNSIFANFDIINTGSDYFKKLVQNAKIVITHFGLFLFESIKLKKRFIIVSPTKYHEKLANKYFKSFHVSGNGKIDSKKFIILLTNLLKEIDNSKIQEQLNSEKENNTMDNKLIANQLGNNKISDKKLIKELFGETLKFIIENNNNINNNCTICGGKKKKIIWMEERYHLLICTKCKTIIKENIRYEKMNEDTKEKYYVDEYKSVYGKTYFDDRENIKKLNKRRIMSILPLLKNANEERIKAIDFGGALGFFLDDLKDELLKVNKKLEGYIIETNSYALSFCENKGYNAYNSIDKLDDKLKNSFDLITFWFCIEHIKNIEFILKKAYELLKQDGILSISFPSQFGPMFYFKKNRNNYFKTRPEDHFYDFNPYSFKKFLKKIGFITYKITIPNIHYKRFNKISLFFVKIIGKKMFEKIINILAFGDICEIYAIKKQRS